MFCPQCEGEYREGVTRCPDCDVPLVESLPPEGHSAPEMVVVFETHEPEDLLAVELALQGADIPFQVLDESSVPGISLGSLDPAGRPAHVRVPKDRAEEALALLSEATAADSGAGDAEDGDDDGS